MSDYEIEFNLIDKQIELSYICVCILHMNYPHTHLHTHRIEYNKYIMEVNVDGDFYMTKHICQEDTCESTLTNA